MSPNTDFPGSGRTCSPPLRRVVSFLGSRTPRKSACAFRAGLGAESIHARIRKGQQFRLVAHRAGLDPPRMELQWVPAPVSMLELARWGINGLLTNARPVWGGERALRGPPHTFNRPASRFQRGPPLTPNVPLLTCWGVLDACDCHLP
jgi:hypothetical protein